MTSNKDAPSNNSSEGWTVPIDPANPGLGRRTVLAGAAWSVPVIAAAIATPLAAASAVEPTLEFINGPYSALSCETLGDVVLQLTTDGSTPDAGTLVTVTLPSGLTWSDGTTAPRLVTTGTDGRITLSGLIASEGAGTYAINASTGVVSATAPVVVGAATRSYNWYNGSGGEATLIPGNATALGYNVFLAENGDLWYGNGVVASGVTAASVEWDVFGTTPYISYIGNGTAYNWFAGASGAVGTVPGDAKPIGYNLFLAPNGDLWFGNGIIATGVSSAEAHWDTYGQTSTPCVGYVSNGVAYNWHDFTSGVLTAVPANATALNYGVFLAPNGDLWFNNSVIATGVTGGAVEWDNMSGMPAISYTSNGTAYNWYNGTSGALTAVPGDATPVGYSVFLAPNGDLWYNNTVIATGATSAVGDWDGLAGSPSPYVSYIGDVIC